MMICLSMADSSLFRPLRIHEYPSLYTLLLLCTIYYPILHRRCLADRRRVVCKSFDWDGLVTEMDIAGYRQQMLVFVV